jgi:hypothetical protein
MSQCLRYMFGCAVLVPERGDVQESREVVSLSDICVRGVDVDVSGLHAYVCARLRRKACCCLYVIIFEKFASEVCRRESLVTSH